MCTIPWIFCLIPESTGQFQVQALPLWFRLDLKGPFSLESHLLQPAEVFTLVGLRQHDEDLLMIFNAGKDNES